MLRMKIQKKHWLKVLLFVLVVPAGTWVVAQGVAALNTPDGSVQRGITMAEVRTQKGEPSSQIGPVGEPAIIKWLYQDGEIVVFEEDRVVDSFVRRQ